MIKPLLAVLALLIFGWCAISLGTDGKDDSPAIATAEDAYYACVVAVRNGLAAPSTAKFTGYQTAAIRLVGDTVYVVVAGVDAQNRFGAMLRKQWACTVPIRAGQLGTPEAALVD